MNKAKAVFTAVIVAVVAGASGVLWYLNDSGNLATQTGGDDSVLTTVATTVGNADNNVNEDADTPVDDAQDDIDGYEDDNAQGGADSSAVSTKSINDFLSVFSKVYFSEDKAFSADKPDTYQLIRFAYTYLMSNNESNISTEYINDDIGYYNKVSVNDVNRILDKYFSSSVESESVYTEKTYAFFKYSDGYFYTPAADGIDYKNICIADSYSQNGDIITVEFSVYSSGVTTDMTSQQARRASNERYASGTAKINVDGDNFTLIYYNITP